MTSTPPLRDPVARNLWYAIAALTDVVPGKIEQTHLLGDVISYRVSAEAQVKVWRGDRAAVALGKAAEIGRVQVKFGYFWVCLGEPTRDIFDLPEYSEPDRRSMNALTVGVNTSGPRVIENFLDMAHFPFVHTDILGSEPHTEVEEYDVSYDPGAWEILATKCRFYQPRASAASIAGVVADYVYKVPHPFCAVLYKSSPDDETRLDLIAVFVQPMDEEHVRAHLMLSVLDKHNALDKHIRLFQQTILGQDKPILENQMPRRLPLDTRAETPIRADKVSIFYRRWLREIGLRYGTIAESGIAVAA